MKKAIIALSLLSISSVQAARVAVIDSGLDFKHEMIVPNLWTNVNETFDNRDEDGNGYQDDVHGWNFAEQNGDIIDYKFLGTFSPDCTKYFDIQGKYMLGQATEEEIAWMKAKVADKKFLTQMSKFGNFVHGTHVAGITARDSNNEVMGVKLIPTEIKPFISGLGRNNKSAVDRWALIEQGFTALAAQQMVLLTDIAKFTAFHKFDVANGSFGTGYNQAKMIGDLAYRVLFFKKPSEEDSKKVAQLFLKALISEGSKFVAAAPEVLFVFAAGNDGLNNDEFGTSPANIRADNVITVGATYKNEFFAKFSNFGTKHVDVAAPGMLIRSAIPGGEYLEVSGTSQAAPYVANIAARIKSANPKLKPLEIKQILMGTVDKKDYLSEKVSTSGIVNPSRAVVAAEMSNIVPVNDAITASISQVKDMEVEISGVKNDATPMPIYPMFQ